jgi:hypothetical protein
MIPVYPRKDKNKAVKNEVSRVLPLLAASIPGLLATNRRRSSAVLHLLHLRNVLMHTLSWIIFLLQAARRTLSNANSSFECSYKYRFLGDNKVCRRTRDAML